ncbi:hypothetical protein LCGC14_0555460 [marine sediment metagenome]|uniref:Uncharacterized protein n=1 Tax=marine sediment metagenome TaxID=412755 RepID=A0A0F9UWV0_9ZZZZ
MNKLILLIGGPCTIRTEIVFVNSEDVKRSFLEPIRIFN